MDRSPPPAPASACAMLSPCWAGDETVTSSLGWSADFDIVNDIEEVVETEERSLQHHSSLSHVGTVPPFLLPRLKARKAGSLGAVDWSIETLKGTS